MTEQTKNSPFLQDERSAFEAAYAAEFSNARVQVYTAKDIASMRDGDGYGERPYLNGHWKGWQARAALAQSSPEPEMLRDRETPAVVAFIHERTGAVANAEMVRTMEEGSVPSGYTVPLMTVSQHDRMTLERWQYFRRKMQQMRDLMRGMRDRFTTAKARVEELETELAEKDPFGAKLNSISETLERCDALLAAQVAQAPKAEKWTYASKQETNCGGCGVRKHTPLRVDWMGGYVCLTCIDEKLEALYDPAQTEQLPEDIRILLARAQGQIEHLAECTENLGEDLEDDDVSEDVAEARALAEEIGKVLAAAPALGGE